MAKYTYAKGSTSVISEVFIPDSSSSTGAGLTGLVYNSAGLTAYYARPGAAAVAITLATQTVTGAYSSGGFVEIDATNMPGWYRFDIPDAVLASGVNSVGIHLKGATNMAPTPMEIQLTSVDLNDGVRGGMTALPNVNSGTNPGSIPVTQDLQGRIAGVQYVQNSVSIDWSLVANPASAVNLTNTTIGTVTDVTNLHASAATTANQTTMLNRIGAFTGGSGNDILGFFRALMRSDVGAPAPSDVGGTYDNTTDSNEAIQALASDAANYSNLGYTAIGSQVIPAQSTAQADLDILTGTDGVTLATTQPNYAPLKPTVSGRTLDVSATGEAGLDFDNINQATLSTTLNNITVPTVAALTGHTPQSGDSYAVISGPDGPLAIHTDTQALISSLAAHETGLASQLATLEAHGDAAWATATGFATPADITTALTEIKGATWSATDTLEAIRDQLDTRMATSHISATAGKVDGVALVDVCSANSDMRGTDGANTTAPDNASVATILGVVNQLIDGVIEANTAGAFHVQMLDSANNPVAGVAVTAQRKLDNGTLATVAGSATSTDAYGLSLFSYDAADVNGTDAVTFRFSATGAVDRYLFFKLSV